MAQPGFGYKNAHPPMEAEKRFGPELAFASMLSRQSPSDHYIVKLAIADTPLAAHSSKDNWSPSGRLFQQLMTMIENAYQSKKDTVKLQIAGLFFMQGETDALEQESAKKNLTDFIAHFRNTIYTGGCAEHPEIPVIIGRIQDNPIWTYRKQVRSAQQAVDQNSASIGLVNTDDFSAELTDPVHYNEYGQTHLGQRFYFSFIALPPKGSITSNNIPIK